MVVASGGRIQTAYFVKNAPTNGVLREKSQKNMERIGGEPDPMCLVVEGRIAALLETFRELQGNDFKI